MDLKKEIGAQNLRNHQTLAAVSLVSHAASQTTRGALVFTGALGQWRCEELFKLGSMLTSMDIPYTVDNGCTFSKVSI